MSRGLKEPAAKTDADTGDEPPMPDLDDPRVERAMMEMERDMEHWMKTIRSTWRT